MGEKEKTKKEKSKKDSDEKPKKSKKVEKEESTADDAGDKKKPKKDKEKKDKDNEKDKKKKKSKSSDEEVAKATKKKDKKAEKEKKSAEKKEKKEKKKKDKKEKKDNNEKKEKKEKGEKKKDKKKKKKEGKSKDTDTGKADKKKKKKKSSGSDEAETICCICKDKGADASAGGMCKHVFCLSCLESLVHKPMADPQDDDNHLAAPTLGRCPECRAELRKFDMTDVKTGKLKYKRSQGLGDAEIKGKIYRPKDKDTHLAHFCFEEDKPYINFQSAIEHEKEKWLMNDGTQVPEFKYFDDGYHWDASTRTFHGTISWQPVTFQGAYRWDVVLGFSVDFSSVHVGLIHERKERQAKKRDKECKVLQHFQYPLDGKWKLLWLNSDGNQQTGSITVRNNEFQQGPYLFNLNFSDPKTPTFRWPLDPVYATAQSGVNLKKKPSGPKIGERIVWETTHPAFAEITWERESRSDKTLQTTQHFGIAGTEYTSASGLKEEPKTEDKKESKSAKRKGDSVKDTVIKQAAEKATTKTKSSDKKDDSDNEDDSDSDSSSSSTSSEDSDGGWSDSSGNTSSEYNSDSDSSSDSDSDSS